MIGRDINAGAGADVTSPAVTAAAVTPNDTGTLAGVRALYVGGAGDVKVDMLGSGTAVTFASVPAGTVLPVAVTRVYSTGTTATTIIALG